MHTLILAAITWTEIVLILNTLLLGYLVYLLQQQKAMSAWPFEQCGAATDEAVEHLLKILSLAQGAPADERSQITMLVSRCFTHDSAYYKPGPNGTQPTHCKAILQARTHAENADWAACIDELTHLG